MMNFLFLCSAFFMLAGSTYAKYTGPDIKQTVNTVGTIREELKKTLIKVDEVYRNLEKLSEIFKPDVFNQKFKNNTTSHVSRLDVFSSSQGRSEAPSSKAPSETSEVSSSSDFATETNLSKSGRVKSFSTAKNSTQDTKSLSLPKKPFKEKENSPQNLPKFGYASSIATLDFEA